MQRVKKRQCPGILTFLIQAHLPKAFPIIDDNIKDLCILSFFLLFFYFFSNGINSFFIAMNGEGWYIGKKGRGERKRKKKNGRGINCCQNFLPSSFTSKL